MLTEFDTDPSHNLLEHELASIFTAVQDMFQSTQPHARRKHTAIKDRQKNKSTNAFASFEVAQTEEPLHYELLSMTLIRKNMAVVKVLQTPIDNQGKKRDEYASTPSLVMAKSGDEWEMVGLPLPRTCLRSAL